MPGYKELTKKILLGCAIGGILAVAVISPPTIKVLWELFFKNKQKGNAQKERRKFSQAIDRIKRNHLIIIKQEKSGAYRVELTEKGKRKIKEFEFETLKIEKQKTWDNQWRIVIFDIPRKHKGRDALREKLKNMGFYQLQESVWAFPYPCKNEIGFIVEFFYLSRYVNFLEVSKVANDAFLKRHFHLL